MILRNTLYKFIFLYFFIFAIHDFSLAQIKTKGIPYINHYSTNDYKGGPDCWQIAQDKRGIMYFGNNGLLQFDGTTWELFPIPNNTIVRSVAIDKSGKIYVGAQGEFGYFLPDTTGSLTYFSLSDKLPKEMKRYVNDIWRIFFTAEDEIIFQDRFAFFTYKNGAFKIVRSASWMSFAHQIDNAIYFGIDSIGLHEFKNGKLQLVNNGDYFKGSKIVAVLPYDAKHLLIVNEKDGLTLYDGTKFTTLITEVNKFVLNSYIMNAISLKDGYYALGSWINGLLIIDKHGNPIQHLNKGKGLQSSVVFGLNQDMHGNLWISTSNGIAHIELNSPYTYYNEHIGVSGAAFGSAIYNNKIYMATNQGILWNEWKDYNNPISSRANFHWVNNVKAQAWNVEVIDNILFGEMDHGLYTIKDTSATPLKSYQGAWKVISLKTFPGYYIKGCYTGLLLYKKENGAIKFIKKLKNFEESSRVMEEDEDGIIWVSHAYKGVFKIHLDKNTMEIASENFYNSSHGLPADISIHVFKINNEIVFTTPKGIYKFNKSANRFEPHKKWNTIFNCTNKYVKKLVEDKYGNIFYLIEDQLGVLYKKEGGVYQINESIFAGFKGEFVKSFEHINPVDSHNIIIGTKDYFVHLDPSLKTPVNNPFLIHVRKVELINDRILFGGSYLNNTGFIVADQPSYMVRELPYNENALRFSFSAASYSDNKIEYSYQLHGFDTDWSSWSTESRKDYTNLGPGNYLFQVKARNSHGMETDIKSYSFKINPSWYRTLFAYFIYGVCALIVLFIAMKVYTLRLKKHNRNLEKIIKERTTEIFIKNQKVEKQNKKLQELNEEKNYLMSVLSHDLRTPVKQVKGLASILKMGGSRSKEEEHELLTKIIGCTDRLNRMISDILDWKTLDTGTIKFNYERLNTGESLREIKNSFRILAKDKNIEIILEDLENCYIQVDKNYFTQILENLISNALKFSPSDKRIFIKIVDHVSKVSIEVKDEGPGLNEEDKKKLFSPYQKLSARPTAGESSTGLGLSIVKKYVEAMHGKVHCESVEGQGAKFYVVFDKAKENTCA